MNLEKAVNHGGHGERGGKARAYVGEPDRMVTRTTSQEFKVFAVPAVFAVVKKGFFG